MLAPTIMFMADAGSAAEVMHSYVAPIVQTMAGLATLVCAFFLVNGGIHYVTSRGNPEKLDSAKTVIRNALIGLILVLGAGVLTTILTHAFGNPGTAVGTKLPTLNGIKPDAGTGGLVGVLLKAITGVLNDLIQTAAKPFLQALTYFTTATPLISDNSGVFNLWLAVTGMADAVFVLVVALLGFHVMSFATFGWEEIEFKQLLPRLALVFALINSSVFLIDGLIGLSNAMIHALYAGFSQTSVWDVLTKVVQQSGGMGLAALLIMVAFLIVAVILLIYYVGRIVTLYLGAVLAPLVFLMGLLPGFRDFALSAAKTYLATVFVLFVHVVILELAATLFTGMSAATADHAPDPLMAMVVGLATLIALLKTQGVMMQLSYASVGPRTARKLGGQFMNGVSYLSGKGRMVAATMSSQTQNRTAMLATAGGPTLRRSQPPAANYSSPSSGNTRTAVKTNGRKDVKSASTAKTDKPKPPKVMEKP